MLLKVGRLILNMNNRIQCLFVALTLTTSLAVAKAQILSVPGQMSGGQFQLSLNGNTGNNYTIEFSTNLINWSPLLVTNPPNASLLNLLFPMTGKTGFYQAYESGITVSQSIVSFGTSAAGTPVFNVNVTNGVAIIPITRSNGTNAACVSYSTSDGTAVGGSDYEPQAGTLCFAAGVTSNSISIPISLGGSPDQSATVNLQLTDTSGSNVLNSLLVIQRPRPILTVSPATITLEVPNNCPQSITIGNAGPQGSLMNYQVYSRVMGNELDFDQEGSVASGSLQAGQTVQISVQVSPEFALDWVFGEQTAPCSIFTPDAANSHEFFVSVTITPDGTTPLTEVLGTWSGTWSGTSEPGADEINSVRSAGQWRNLGA